MKMNVYIIVFGIIVVIIIAALASTFFFNQSSLPSPQQNISLSSLKNYGPAPNIQGISGWINSAPLNLTQFRGKVVIVDFWTYSCINCIRSIPYLNAWYKEYGGNNGLVIIGVSTPEFQFEHNYTNVKNAVEKDGIMYPVALDNNYSTWTAYNNEYWPADYIIDKNGDIRYEVFGEGGYNTTQQVIVELLKNAGYNVSDNMTLPASTTNFSLVRSPEMYLGYQEIETGRTDVLGNPQGYIPNNAVNYTATNISQGNTVYLEGAWYDANYSIVSESNNSKLFLVYDAKNLNVVASGNTSITVKIDGKPANQSFIGTDGKIVNGTDYVTINQSRLYDLINAPSYGIHEIEIDAHKGFHVYTFTFG